ncbi:Signal transduction histidine kinase [Desulfacinum hydrothermale DSM 13146]|uniref:histidine kinase n=1 Tax=Desulfacinum hydrothermale DSM 13146 TaxID=1121390 RepID=A0A1W1XVZ5_9BACT|nr:HAMP domain-containing sensor histidine kinase [Desulfacinum hydrothermale]SMC28160.1 Signal transduction histidine kinase [Desulfacinum hydrothermale DSM 13146]
MTVRQKITLLITAAGFLSSLVFSCIVLWEMLEQPFQIIDSELEAMARHAVHFISKSKQNRTPDDPSFIGNERYWLVVLDQDSGKSIYRSSLARLIKIPEPAPGVSVTSSLIIPRGKIDLGQDERNEVTFRIRNFKIAYGGKTFLATVGRPVEKLEEELWDIFIGVVSALAFSVLLLLAISYFLAGFILKPIRLMNEQARNISEKHLDRRVPVSGSSDEFNALAQTLNQVFDRLQHAFLRQKRLLADASHELKTPLTMMRLALDAQRSIQGEIQPDRRVQSHGQLTEQVLRMERLVKSLLDLSALEIEASTTEESINLVNLLGSLITDYRLLAEPRNIRLDVRLPQQLVVQGNEDQLNRAFSNILDNAIKYNVDDGRVRVIGDQSGMEITVKVENTGAGVGEAEVPKVFEPFYRVEKSRSTRLGGSGLGLAIVKRIVELHGGKVKFESQERGWTRVTVSLPRNREKIPV